MYRPCQVVLRTGEVVDRVYVSDARSYMNRFGSWPWEGRESHIPVTEIAEIRPSPTRIPARFANKMYHAGESGMGYCVFTLVLRDGRRLPFVTTGNAVDFLNLPRGVSPAHIVDLLPHVGRDELHSEGRWTNDPHQQSAEFRWSLYRT